MNNNRAEEPSPLVSIVIPVKNAAWIIKAVLEGVARQDTPWSFEVIIIDSGSTDGTVDIVRKFDGFRLVQIKPEEYGHGRTRNFGVEISKGKYVAFLTHDAIPYDEHWLENLVNPMLEDELVAGVFGRHVAHDGATTCIRRDLEAHFDGLHALGKVLWLEDEERYASDVGYRQILHFYSDNNSCLRKSVWNSIPYPDVSFAEDQLWAKAIIERGYRKFYAHDAVVRHSHDYGPWETFQRSFDESMAFNRYFGYVLAGHLLPQARNALIAAVTDYRYAYRHPDGGMREAIAAAFNQLGKHAGHWFGAHSERLPVWFKRSISLDMKLKYGRFTMKDGLKKFWKILREDGARAALSRTLGAAARRVETAGMAIDTRNDVAAFYRAILPPEYLPKGVSVLSTATPGHERVDALWFIPDFGEGSGGHLNIFRFLRGMERMGMKSAVCIVGGNAHHHHAIAKAKIERFFGAIEAKVYFENDDLPEADRIIATSWITAHYAKHYPCEDGNKYYFIQDYEPHFYPAGFDATAAAMTYDFGFKAICAGSWLVEMLDDRHSVRALGSFGFSFDHQTYRPTAKRDEIKRVFFYARPPTARRGFELGMLALDLVGRLRPDVHFIFAGWDISSYKFDHVHLNAGILSTSELPDLYSQCDVALILSFSNMSLLPYEVMACNCAVVSNDDACATWGLNEEVATFASPNPESLAEAIIYLLDNDDGRQRKVAAAKEYVDKTDWNTEIRRVYDLLMEGRQE